MLFDQNVPRPLRRFLKACEVKVADEMGWGRTRNGLLLQVAEQEGFEVLLTGDRTIQHEQNMHGRRIGLVSMSDNHWRFVKHYVAAIEEAVQQVRAGEVREVFCGKFVAQKVRDREPS